MKGANVETRTQGLFSTLAQALDRQRADLVGERLTGIGNVAFDLGGRVGDAVFSNSGMSLNGG